MGGGVGGGGRAGPLPVLVRVPARLSPLDEPRWPADSIMGVTFFGDEAPDEFGCFERAFLTVFGITAGDTWVGTPPCCLS